MRALPRAVVAIALMLVWGCAGSPTDDSAEQRLADRMAKPAPAPVIQHPPLVGGYQYRAAGLSGAYAGYPALWRFIDRMVGEHGFPRNYLNGLFSQVERKQWTIRYMNRQKGTGRPRRGGWSRYRAKFLTKKHISKGAAYWVRYASALNRANQRYGVPPEYILGIMGVETIYGGNVGNHRVIDALTTLAFDYPRRASYFEGELENFLLMARDEAIDPGQPVGSFAGAMGLGQFMPTSFLRWAVDFNGDGRRDLWNPVDTIGSVANSFAQHGWRPEGQVVTSAVATSPAASTLDSGFDTRYSLTLLADYNIYPAEPMRGSNPVRLIRLSTYKGNQYWLGHQNFYVITRYNHSSYYAMAVHQLAQAVKRRYWTTSAALR